MSKYAPKSSLCDFKLANACVIEYVYSTSVALAARSGKGSGAEGEDGGEEGDRESDGEGWEGDGEEGDGRKEMGREEKGRKPWSN